MATNPAGIPQKPIDRSYNFIEKIGTLDGQIDVLNRKIEILQSNQASSNTTMSAKNNLSFSGRVDEDVDELITKLKFLKIANNWSDQQLYGQTLVTFKNDAFRWYQAADKTQFETAAKIPSFDLLVAKLKERFQKDETEGDVLYKIFEFKQKRGQGVNEYMSEMFEHFNKIPNVKEEMKVTLLINGFIPSIRDQLKLKVDKLTTISNVELWARRIEPMTLVKSSGQQYTPPSESVNATNKSQSYEGAHNNISCYICNGPHLKRNCPQRDSYRPPRYFRGRSNQYRGYRGGNFNRNQNRYYEGQHRYSADEGQGQDRYFQGQGQNRYPNHHHNTNSHPRYHRSRGNRFFHGRNRANYYRLPQYIPQENVNTFEQDPGQGNMSSSGGMHSDLNVNAPVYYQADVAQNER